MNHFYYIAGSKEFRASTHGMAYGILVDDPCFVEQIAYNSGAVPWHFPITDVDCIELDQHLVQWLNRVCTVSVIAAAAGACAWETGPISGGVIGQPNDIAESPCGTIELVSDFLWQWSAPGLFGLIAETSLENMLEMVSIVETHAHSGFLEPFLSWASQHNIRTYLAVADSSGQRGFLAVKASNGQICIPIE